MADVLQIVNDNLYSLLTHATHGYNASITAVAGRYGIDATKYAIDWTPGKQFFWGDITPDDMDSTTSHAHFLWASLWTESAEDQHYIKFEEFSGVVIANLQFVFSWRNTRATVDFETPQNAVADAVIHTLNDPHVTGWDAPVAYNGRISVRKTTVG